MYILDIYNKLVQYDVLTKNAAVLGTIIGGMISLPPAKIEIVQLREQFNLTGMGIINKVLNPLVELSPGLNVTDVVEAAFRSYQLRYLALYDFGTLLTSTITLCDVLHTSEYDWASEIYGMLYEHLFSLAE